MSDQIAPVLQISEIRAVAQDELWMSPFYRQPCIGIHFTLIKNWEAVRPVLMEVDERLHTLGARPHWGKRRLSGLHPSTIPTTIQSIGGVRARECEQLLAKRLHMAMPDSYS